MSMKDQNHSSDKHIAMMLTSLAPTGGVERDATKCIEALSSAGWHIHLIVAFPHPDMPRLLSHLNVSWYRIRTFKRPPSIGQMIFVQHAFSLVKKLRSSYPDMDVISFENHPVATVVLGSNSRKLWREARRKFGMGISLRPVWEWWSNYCERFSLKNATKVALYSERVRNQFVEDGADISKLDRIIIPVDTAYYQPNTDIPLEQRNELLIVGANTRLKGIDITLQAWKTLHKRHPDLRLRIVSKGFKTPALIKKYALPNVISSPLVQDPREYYDQARLVLFPSVFESWGNIILEALSSGIPVVASFQAPSSEIIQSSDQGVCFNRTGNEDDVVLLEAIEQVFQKTPDTIESMYARQRHVQGFQQNHQDLTQWVCATAESLHQDRQG